MEYIEKIIPRDLSTTENAQSSRDSKDRDPNRTGILDKHVLRGLPPDIAERLESLACPELWYPSPIKDASQIDEENSYLRHIRDANLSMLPSNIQELARYAASRRHQMRALIARDNYDKSQSTAEGNFDAWTAGLARRVVGGEDPKLHPYETIEFMTTIGMSSTECGRRTHLGDFATESIQQMTDTLKATVEYYGGSISDEKDTYRVESLDTDDEFTSEFPFSHDDAVVVTRRKNVGSIHPVDGIGAPADDIEVRLRTSYLLPINEQDGIDKIVAQRDSGSVTADVAKRIESLIASEDIQALVPLSSTAYAFNRNAARCHEKINPEQYITLEDSTSDYIGYDDVIAEKDSKPTPLDPKHVKIDGQSYEDYKRMMIDELAHGAARQFELSRKSTMSISKELRAENEVLINRNQQAMERLGEIIKENPELSQDHVFQSSLENAKYGNANLEELIYILKQCPDIISLEAMNFVKPCDRAEIEHARALFDADLEGLTRRDFEGDITTVPKSEQRMSEKIDDVTGARIQKRIIAQVSSAGISIEIVQKDVSMALSFYGGTQAMRPISTAIYLRVADHMDRKAYDTSSYSDSDTEKLYDDYELIIKTLKDIGQVATMSPEIQRQYNIIPTLEGRHAYAEAVFNAKSKQV